MQNLYFATQSLLNREISRFSASLFLAAALAVLAGCGSGQAIPTVPLPASSTDTTTGPAVASIQLLASSPQIDSSGAKTVDLTAVVLSATKQTISGKTVTFSTGSDSTAFVNNISASGVSDANGTVTAKLNIGGNKANRTISLSASASSVTGSASVDVTGTTITVSGNGSLTSGATTTLTFSVKDSAGTAIPGVTVTVASATGNTIALTPATGITNSAGQISAAITATAVGNDTITATAAGTSTTQTLTVSPDSFSFATLANTDIPLGTAQAISVNWTKNGAAITDGTAVSFSTSRGAVSASSVNTVGGVASGVTVSSATTAGPAIITATGPGGTPAATLDVVFVATSASTVTAQAVPGTVSYTTGSASQTNNSSTISVLVRDASNNLVKNASVNFTITADPSGGKLTSNNVVTDVSGSASVTYVAGATSSPANGVVISASVTKVNSVTIPTISATTSLTVAGQANLVSLGTDNKVGGEAPINTKTYIATVTDTAGNRVAGATVVFSLRPSRFAKGVYVKDTVNNVWVQSVKVICANEDTNFDGIIQTGEDISGNGKLDPGAPATVNATGTTDAAGNATATITYAKDRSNWAEMTLEARTGVAGNDPPTTATFFLPGVAADYTSISIAPPGQTSPYGAGTSTLCTNNN